MVKCTGSLESLDSLLNLEMSKENHFVLLKLKENSIVDDSLKDFCVELETCALHLWKVDVYRQDLAWF